MSHERLAGAAFVSALMLLCCGGTAWSAPLTIKEHHKAPVGEYLTNGNGRTVYMFTADKNGTSHCSGKCAVVWPPVMSMGTPKADAGVKASDLGTIKRGSEKQVTYNGMPLYYFIKDKKPGTIAGEGIDHFGGHWYVVSPSGQAVLPSGKKMGHG